MPLLQKILYVEDEPDIQLVARVALEAFGGYQLAVCSSGAEALNIAPEFMPDLFLLDVMMPGMDGPETLSRFRQLPMFTDIPVIFITAKIQPDEIKYLLSLGAIGVIAKPFEPLNLSSQIQTFFDTNPS